MEAKTVLIVIDENEHIIAVAREIAACLSGKKVIVKEAKAFSPTDLLPADAYFFGCAEPKPLSFAELERSLLGINLAGRSCGLFTIKSDAAVKYLQAIVSDAEPRVNPFPYLGESGDNVAAWVAQTLNEA